MVTIKDIANRLGIAPSTVSKGLNDASDISPELKKLVLDTAIEMGYVTKRMKKETRKRLCIFIENMQYERSGDFGFDIILGFRQAALRDNWDVTVVPITPVLQLRDPYDRYMVKNNYHGGFLVGFALKDPWMAQLETTTIPTVLFDNYIRKNPNVAYVGTDSFEGIDLAIDHLTELGHTKIALLNGSPDSMVTVNRYDAYVSSMQSHNLEVDENLVAYGYYVEESAKYHLPSLIEHGATAILCGNDLLAVGVIRECERLNIKIPEALSVVGFDNLPIAQTISPALTTINQDRIDLGRNSYAALYWLIAKVPISRSLLRPQLIVRDTTFEVNSIANK
ncbi:MAG: LacI family DNA-binding transcriptional regulator [Lachnospiraceae bacterium]|nr:LacI family DNA-binding transcriptional regulator [Lachnospiraceae bacterium]